MISVSVVNPLMLENGWTFEDGYKVTPDPVINARYLHQVYTAAQSDYSGRVTVPTLWDKKQGTIVSNESADIIRMFNSAFDDAGAAPGDYYPEELRAEIDAVNERVYDNVNNGVYKAGFATSQQAYEEAVLPLFETLDWLEDRLDENRYLCGARLTEADWRLFTTLIRFDSVYVGHFKCNLRRIEDYPNLSNYLRELYQMPGVAETVDFHAIKLHYYGSHKTINPTGVVPMGPALDFHRPHGRQRLQARPHSWPGSGRPTGRWRAASRPPARAGAVDGPGAPTAGPGTAAAPRSAWCPPRTRHPEPRQRTASRE